jgi:hypothetical protein
MSSKEIYVSTDVEVDGPIPGPNSMLSFGSAACTGILQAAPIDTRSCGADRYRTGLPTHTTAN